LMTMAIGVASVVLAGLLIGGLLGHPCRGHRRCARRSLVASGRGSRCAEMEARVTRRLVAPTRADDPCSLSAGFRSTPRCRVSARR
jgi:hypothetical protein